MAICKTSQLFIMSSTFQPLTQLTLFLAFGLFLGNSLELTASAAKFIMALLLVTALISILLGQTISRQLIIALFFPLGLLLWNGYGELSSEVKNIANYANGEKITVEGTVKKRVENKDKKVLIIEAESIYRMGKKFQAKGGIRMTVVSQDTGIITGDKVRFWGKLKKPRNFGNPGGFDYEGFLQNRGIFATISLKSDRFITIMGEGNILWRLIYNFRGKVREVIEENSSKKSKGILMAITLGDRGYLEEESIDAFRKTGLAHLLAISGLHMGIVAFFFYSLFKWTLSRSEKILLFSAANRGAAILTLFPITLYLLASGMATPAVRAYIMVITFLLSIIFDRENEIYNTLSLAALIILALWPQALFDAAFQLSFAAVIFIIYVTPRLESLLFKIEYVSQSVWLKKITTFIIVSFSASLGTAPIIIYYFNEISTVSILANILVLPFIAFIAVPMVSIATFASIFFLPIAHFFISLADIIVSEASHIISLIAIFPFSSVLVEPPRVHEIILFYILSWSVFNVKNRLAFLSIIIIPIFFISSSGFTRLLVTKENMTVTFLSVGQGESTLIEFPNKRTMLIDGGGFYDNSFDVGKMVVRPFLLHHGIKKIDYLVMTHPHNDHMNGLIHILKEFEIGEVWTTNESIVDNNHKIFKEVIVEKNIYKKQINDSVPTLYIGKVEIDFLHPPLEFSEGNGSGSKINNRSIVMLLKYGKRSFLLTGDLEEEGEDKILKNNHSISADVLKAGHHGSQTSSSSEFIRNVSPQFAVFTVGYKNRFHFPKEAVVERFKDFGIKMYRTDLHGAITFITDGEDLQISTFM